MKDPLNPSVVRAPRNPNDLCVLIALAMLIVPDRIPGLRVRQVPADPAQKVSPMVLGPIGPKVCGLNVPIALIGPAASIRKAIGQSLNQNLSGCFLSRPQKRQQLPLSLRAFRICWPNLIGDTSEATRAFRCAAGDKPVL